MAFAQPARDVIGAKVGGLGSGMNGVDCIAQVLECQRQERACKLSVAPALTSCAWALQLALLRVPAMRMLLK